MTQAENGWSKAEREVMARLRGIERTQRETNSAIGDVMVGIGRLEERIDHHRHSDLEGMDGKLREDLWAEVGRIRTDFGTELEKLEVAVGSGEGIRKFWSKAGDAAIGFIVPLLIAAALFMVILSRQTPTP